MGFVVAEIGFGFTTHSLALLADAGHNASDVLGLLLAWGAQLLRQRPATVLPSLSYWNQKTDTNQTKTYFD